MRIGLTTRTPTRRGREYFPRKRDRERHLGGDGIPSLGLLSTSMY
jgi:hypothetical protein